MVDQGGRPLEGVTARLADQRFSTLVAGWWLASLGADVSDSRPTSPGADPDHDEGDGCVPAVVRRFLVRNVADMGSGAWGAVDVVLGDDAPEAPSGIGTVVRCRAVLASGGVSAEQVLWAECGLADLTRELRGRAGIGDPCVPSNRQPSILAGAMMALLSVSVRVGCLLGATRPAIAEVDPRGLLALLPMQPLARAQLAPGPSASPGIRFPGGVFEAADGPVYARPVEPDHWRELLSRVPGMPAPADGIFLGWDPQVVDEHLAGWMHGQRRDELVSALQDQHVPMAPVRTIDQMLEDPHLRTRRFASRGPDPELRPPWIVVSDGQGTRSPAARPAGRDGPLSGIQVLDLTWAWAGPFATRLLADLGADVLNIEWYPRASNLRTQAPFAPGREGSPDAGGWWSSNQRGKRSVGVNLKHPDGRALVHTLAETSHLTMENFAPGVVERLGVAYEDVIRRNPSMVYVSMSGWGRRGPFEHWIGYGTHVQAAAGADLAMPSSSGGPSHMLIPYADPVSGLYAALGTVAYLYAALSTGRSVHLDVSELECMALTLLEPLIEAASGSEPTLYPYSISTDGTSSRLHPYGSDPTDPGVPVLSMAEMLGEPRFADLWIPDRTPGIVDTGARIVRTPWSWDGAPAGTGSGAPSLFADTRSVLQEVVGLDDAEIDRLVDEGAIATADAEGAPRTDRRG